ncbi:hypothetical protein HN587_06600 [Candidatus Woesearchaeota archaeon]|jgi:hypothetical protein|nr:hypothetical protein [Candidatus Woesearchaeota archaeon]
MKTRKRSGSIIILALLVFTMFFLVGCACDEKEVKYFEKVPIIENKANIVESTETIQEEYLDKECISVPNYELELGELTWLNGEKTGDNQAKRTVTITNPNPKLVTFYFDKVFLAGEEEVWRSSPSYEQKLPAKGSRNVYLIWNTEYSKDKDIVVDLMNKTSIPGKQSCEFVKKTKDVEISVNTTVPYTETHFETVIKTKKVCT